MKNFPQTVMKQLVQATEMGRINWVRSEARESDSPEYRSLPVQGLGTIEIWKQGVLRKKFYLCIRDEVVAVKIREVTKLQEAIERSNPQGAYSPRRQITQILSALIESPEVVGEEAMETKRGAVSSATERAVSTLAMATIVTSGEVKAEKPKPKKKKSVAKRKKSTADKKASAGKQTSASKVKKAKAPKKTGSKSNQAKKASASSTQAKKLKTTKNKKTKSKAKPTQNKKPGAR